MPNSRYHAWTASDDAIVKQWVDGLTACARAAAAVGVSVPAIRFRARRLGLLDQKRPPRKAHKPVEMPRPSDGWVAVAHKAELRWVPLDGAPMTIEEAQAMHDAGLAFLAQRRVDGGFDLVVRVRA